MTVIDPRTVFATKERFPDADEVIAEWPDKFLAGAPVGPDGENVLGRKAVLDDLASVRERHPRVRRDLRR